MTIKEFREKSAADVEKLIMDFREQCRELRFAIKEGKEKNVRNLRAVKKTIAKAMTVLHEKKRSATSSTGQATTERTH